MNKLERSFYRKSSIQLAQDLVGKVLVHKINGQKVSGRIVEVEAYMGIEDKAAHSYGGKRTKRTEVMFGMPGILYVFLIYGMYSCVNIVAGELEEPQAVLIRGIEPLDGVDKMAFNRYGKTFEELSKKERVNITNGPGKLCIAMGIDKTANGVDLCKDDFFVEDDKCRPEIVSSKRIGIDYAEEAVDFLWRYHIKDNRYVSKG
ncbi:MAG: DNA-3-methyladenine glycosylase [Clostridiaceae bacterium]|nr:DNA-3-methyladenine glycosylase [Clostridiaceae bacterium]